MSISNKTTRFFNFLCISLFSILFLFSSCKKEEEIPQVETDYFPLQTGSVWTYQTENGNFVHTLTNQTKNVGGFDWKILTVSPNVADENILLRIDPASKIVYRAIDLSDNGGILLIEAITDLDAKVGDTWTQNNEQDGVFLNFSYKVLEKDAKKTVGGTEYDKVMVVKVDASSNFFDTESSTLYFADGVGLIAEEFEDGDYIHLIDFK
ncbi:hypothetical protein [Bernardetia sp.]|uniref:hypothetical protein n=1 Tax=Bernardetia sp. TaxID=1937974 RepID=UPI0025BB299E|nr:hypothetical protein [Bernardetia sp.]